jgi:hypothetical protein
MNRMVRVLLVRIEKLKMKKKVSVDGIASTNSNILIYYQFFVVIFFVLTFHVFLSDDLFSVFTNNIKFCYFVRFV